MVLSKQYKKWDDSNVDHQDGENDPLPGTETINLVPIFFRLKGFTDPHIIVMIHPNLLYSSSSEIAKYDKENPNGDGG